MWLATIANLIRQRQQAYSHYYQQIREKEDEVLFCEDPTIANTRNYPIKLIDNPSQLASKDTIDTFTATKPIQYRFN